MPQILVEALAKTYRVAERAPGLAGALRGLVHRQWRAVHALADVSFSLEAGQPRWIRYIYHSRSISLDDKPACSMEHRHISPLIAPWQVVFALSGLVLLGFALVQTTLLRTTAALVPLAAAAVAVRFASNR